MQQLTIFMDIESSRSYIDELYSTDGGKIVEALVTLKNTVIGSNRQKSSVIQQGIVPRLLQLMADESLDPNIRVEATITIGSLAKGTAENVASLVEQGTATVLVELLKTVPVESKLAEAVLCALRSVFLYPPAPVAALPADMMLLTRLTQIAREGSDLARGCVVRVLSLWCTGTAEQEALCAAGACGAAAALLHSAPPRALPALDLLAAMCFENASVSQQAMNTRYKDRAIPELLTYLVSRDKPLPVAMGAARCLTYMHRAGALTADDSRVVFGALPCLARLCTKEMPEEIRATAAETLAYLAEVDTSLQRLAAISNHLMSSLADIVNCNSAAAKQGAFKCFASLGANDEDIRKRIIETHGLMVHVVNGMNNPEPAVRLAAVRCLHSLSRSVQQLRTTFQDHAVWRPLMQLLSDSPGTELLTVGSSTLCNLLLEFSPAKEPMLDQGAVEMLCNLTKRPEAALRLNGIWALMNMAFQAEQKVKQRILSCLGTEQMFRLLSDADTRVIMKTLGLLRNLLSTRQHIDAIMSEYSSQVMQAVIVVLEGSYPAEVKEQALCILGNIGDGEKAKDLIMANEDVLRKLVDYLAHPESKLQEAALFVAGNLVWRGEAGAAARQARLAELGVLRALQLLRQRKDHQLHDNTPGEQAAGNLVWRGEAGAAARQARLAELGVLRALQLLRQRKDHQLHDNTPGEQAAGNLVWRGEAGAAARQARLAELGVLRALQLLRQRKDHQLHDKCVPIHHYYYTEHTRRASCRQPGVARRGGRRGAPGAARRARRAARAAAAAPAQGPPAARQVRTHPPLLLYRAHPESKLQATWCGAARRAPRRARRGSPSSACCARCSCCASARTTSCTTSAYPSTTTTIPSTPGEQAAGNLVWRGEAGAAARQARLAELGVLRALQLLRQRKDHQLHDKCVPIHHYYYTEHTRRASCRQPGVARRGGRRGAPGAARRARRAARAAAAAPAQGPPAARQVRTHPPLLLYRAHPESKLQATWCGAARRAPRRARRGSPSSACCARCSCCASARTTSCTTSAYPSTTTTIPSTPGEQAAGNLVWRGEAGAAARQARLAELGVLRALQLLRQRKDHQLHDKCVPIHHYYYTEHTRRASCRQPGVARRGGRRGAPGAARRARRAARAAAAAPAQGPPAARQVRTHPPLLLYRAHPESKLQATWCGAARRAPRRARRGSPSSACCARCSCCASARTTSCTTSAYPSTTTTIPSTPGEQAAGNLVWRGEAGAAARQARLAELGVLRALQLLRQRKDHQLHDKCVL
ncbi:uncharacterized protein LOC134652310 [Cydia amplana]|uniref:uncharacterized protein LOC134652310 n=1 Tax=Cydia amplana TaxID=1869771 RepID=UPI002FE59D9B